MRGQIQALERTQPITPLHQGPGQASPMTTFATGLPPCLPRSRWLLGRVAEHTFERHRHEVLTFLKLVAKTYPSGPSSSPPSSAWEPAPFHPCRQAPDERVVERVQETILDECCQPAFAPWRDRSSIT